MGEKACIQGDVIKPVGTHTHYMIVPPSPSPVPFPYVCQWSISGNVSANVFICGKAAALEGSCGFVKHDPKNPANGNFANLPLANEGKATITVGSGSVRINNKAAARAGSLCMTCNEPLRVSSGKVDVPGERTVYLG